MRPVIYTVDSLIPISIFKKIFQLNLPCNTGFDMDAINILDEKKDLNAQEKDEKTICFSNSRLVLNSIL